MSKQEAKVRAESLVPEMMAQYGGGVSNSTYEWRGDRLSFSGRVSIASVRGTLSVTDTDLDLDIDGIPFFLQGTARSRIERWLEQSWPQ